MGSENGCLPIDYCESPSFMGGNAHRNVWWWFFLPPPLNAIILIIIERSGGSQTPRTEFSWNGLDQLCKWYFFCEADTPCFVGHTDIHRLWGHRRRLSFSLLPHHMIEHPYTLQPYTLSSVILLHITIYLASSTQTCNQAEQQAASAAMSFQFLHIFSFLCALYISVMSHLPVPLP